MNFAHEQGSLTSVAARTKIGAEELTLLPLSLMSGRGFVRGLFVFLGLGLLILPAFAYASVGAPVNLAIVGSKYTNDTTPTFTWSAGSGATWYEYRVDNGAYVGISNVFTQTIGPLSDGWHSFAVRAHNNNGEVSGEVSMIFEIDTVGPVVPAVSPSTATEDEAVTFTVTPSGEAWTTACTLYVGGASAGAMTGDANGKYSKTYTFTNDGHYSVHATCTDGDGNTTVGTSRTVTVDEHDDDDVAQEGDLIKTATSSAVYYYGEDGKRHAFPNEDVFYSWYDNFEDVITVSSSFMSGLTIGHNVTIKPGTTTVKFATSAAVYAVAEGGVLRHYLTPALVEADYGSDWSRYDLVVIPDVFFGNYTVGADIDSSTDYDPDDAEDGVTSIDDNF